MIRLIRLMLEAMMRCWCLSQRAPCQTMSCPCHAVLRLAMLAVADYKRGLGMLSGAFPAKLKAIRILHPNRALALALSIAMPLLSAKMRARQVFYSTMEYSDLK